MAAVEGQATNATVRFRDARGALVFEDLVPLRLGAGSAYREYRLARRV
jgi:hypothetical protein